MTILIYLIGNLNLNKMTKTTINCKNPTTGKRCLGVLDNLTKIVTLLRGKKYKLKELEKIDTNGIGYFETRHQGKTIQKIGKFEQDF